MRRQGDKRPAPHFLVTLGRLISVREKVRDVRTDYWHFGLRPRLGVDRKWHVVLLRERAPRPDDRPPADDMPQFGGSGAS